MIIIIIIRRYCGHVVRCQHGGIGVLARFRASAEAKLEAKKHYNRKDKIMCRQGGHQRVQHDHLIWLCAEHMCWPSWFSIAEDKNMWEEHENSFQQWMLENRSWMK